MVGLFTLSPVLIPGTEPQSKSRLGDLATRRTRRLGDLASSVPATRPVVR